jgi:hypothetical protein
MISNWRLWGKGLKILPQRSALVAGLKGVLLVRNFDVVLDGVCGSQRDDGRAAEPSGSVPEDVGGMADKHWVDSIYHSIVSTLDRSNVRIYLQPSDQA